MDPSSSYAPPAYDQVLYNVKQPAAQFCTQCGHPCGGFKFCSSCGYTVDATSSTPLLQQPSSFITQPPVVISQPSAEVCSLLLANIRTDNYSVRINDRLIYDFEKEVDTGCGRGRGLEPEVKDHIPVELSEKGITAMEWHQWMSQLNEIQKNAPISKCLCYFMFFFPGLYVQGAICAICCPLSANHCCSPLPCCFGDYYAAFRNWMGEVNKTLTRHGMHAKLLTYRGSNTPRSKLSEQRVTGHGYLEMSFLAIALNPDESLKLKHESWNQGVGCLLPYQIGRCV